jgi:hypothetical protein
MQKGHGHKTPLATQPQSTETDQNYLEAREDKLGGLLHKASATCSPCQCQIRIFDQGKDLAEA